MHDFEVQLAALITKMGMGDETAFEDFCRAASHFAMSYILGAGAGIEQAAAVDVAITWARDIATRHHVASAPYVDWLIHQIEKRLHNEYFADAVKLQQSWYRTIPPLPRGIRARVASLPRKRLSGDFVFADVIRDQVLFALGDVASHGAAAAYSASVLRQHLFVARRELLSSADHPSTYLHALANRLHDILAAANLHRPLVPIVFALFDASNSAVTVLNCGSHATPIHIRGEKANHIAEATTMLGMPIAPAPNIWTAELTQGDAIILLSDGLIEQSRSQFDRHKMREHVESLRTSNPDELVNGVLTHLDSLSPLEPPEDDQTIIVISIEASSRAGTSTFS